MAYTMSTTAVGCGDGYRQPSGFQFDGGGLRIGTSAPDTAAGSAFAGPASSAALPWLTSMPRCRYRHTVTSVTSAAPAWYPTTPAPSRPVRSRLDGQWSRDTSGPVPAPGEPGAVPSPDGDPNGDPDAPGDP